jgi:small subunit ribosomal protein S11
MNKIKKLTPKKLAIITINSTQNNTILFVRDSLGNFITKSSAGLALKKKRGKRSIASAAQISSELISTKLMDLGYSKVCIKVKGFGRGRESALFGFSSSSLKIKKIMDVTPIPHNGCRQKKRRRL